MNKSTWIAVLVFVGLAAAALVSWREKPERGITRLSFAQVDPATVDRVVVKSPEEIELRREGDEWKVGGKRADGDAVERLLEVVATVRSSDLETSNAERFAEMEVDDAKGASVRLFRGDEMVADFVVGGAGQTGSHVRVGDSVYAVRGLYRATFAREPAGWVEKRLFFDPVDEVTRVDVALAGQPPYALVADGASWKLEDPSLLSAGQRFDAATAAALVRGVVTARAADVLDDDPGDAAGLTAGADTLRLTTKAGETRTLTLGAAQAEGAVYARSSARQGVMTLRSNVAEGLRKSVADLRDLTLLSFASDDVRKLEISGAEGEVVFEKEAAAWVLASSSAAPSDGFVLDETLVQRRLATLASQKAAAVAAPDDPGFTQVDTSPQHVSITQSDGSVATLRFGAETKWRDQDMVLARGNAEAGVFLVRKSARDQLLGGLETFRRREDANAGGLGGLDPQALQNLPPEVRESLLKQLQEKAQRDELMQKAIEAQAQ